MIETINNKNLNVYQVPQGYKKISTPIVNNDISAVYTRNEGKLVEPYNYKEDCMENGKDKNWDNFKLKMVLDNQTLYNLMQKGENVETLNPYEISATTKSSIGSSTKYEQSNQSTKDKIDLLNQKITKLKEQPDSMYLYGVSNSQEGLSINSLYAGSCSGNYKPRSNEYSQADIDHVLKLNGLDANEGNRWGANKLLQYGMDVTKDSVVQIQNIKSAVENINEYDEKQKAVEDIDENKNPGDRPLIKEKKILYSEMDMKQVVEELSKIDDKTIKDVIGSGKEVTIGNLKEMMHKNTRLALKDTKTMAMMTAGEKVDQAVEKATSMESNSVSEVKGQIKEIRARLTAEAAQKISEKMPLESTELSKIAKELIMQEKETIQKALKQVELPINEDNLTVIKDVMEATKAIAGNTSQTAKLQLQAPENTLEEVHKALNAYEVQETKVERRFGETVKKVEGQIQSFLEKQQIPVTKEAIQAAKALIANEMPLTKENLDKVEPIVNKVNTFIEEMTPYRAAALIKEGVNPYKASIETTLDWVAKTKVPELKGNIAEMIVALEQKGNVSESQKQSMLGFYRILHAVDTKKEEVIGYLFRNESELTIEKLQEASKYVGKSKHVEAVVDDQFGELETNDINSDTAKEKIAQSQEDIDKLLDATKVLEKIELPLSKENISSVNKLNSILYPFIKNHFKEQMGKFEGMNTLPPSLMEKVESIKDVSPEIIQLMDKQNIPITISNVYWTQKLIQDPDLYAKMLQEHKLMDKNLPKNLQEVEEKVKNILDSAKEDKEESMKKGDISSYKGYKELEEMVNLQKELMNKGGIYQVPFMINGETKMVHLQIKKQGNTSKGNKDTIEAVIKYDTKNMGTLIAKVSIYEDDIKYEVSGETKAITEKVKEKVKDLDKMLGIIGYSVLKESNSVSTSTYKHQDSQFETTI